MPKPQNSTQSGWFCFLAIVWLFTLAGQRESGAQERLIPCQQREKWGYKKSSGEVVIRPQFKMRASERFGHGIRQGRQYRILAE